MDTIIFKAVPDFPAYEVSNIGTIRRRKKDGSYRTMKPWWKDRHLAVKLTNGSVSQRHPLHRLVLITFGPPQPENLPSALHYDDDAKNNEIGNLVWGDKRMNAQMAVLNGRIIPHHLKTYLTKDEATAALSEYLAGSSMAKVAKKFGCSRWTISNIVHGRTAKFL
jgi:hypothetical protein